MDEISPLDESDYSFIAQHLDDWWGGRQMAAMLPRLWFKDFSQHSLVIRDESGQPKAFLVGYISNQDSSKGYVHFIGVNPKQRNSGLGSKLYEEFATKLKLHGVSRIEAVTSPMNSNSLKFHERLGFMAIQIDGSLEKPTKSSFFTDYDGPGEDRVLLVKSLKD